MITAQKEVAMKFTDSSEYLAVENAAREYTIYSYLNAIHNNYSNIEIYGIPSVYYYGRWDGFILMALTLLDTTVKEKPESNVLDVLIIFREFVSKTRKRIAGQNLMLQQIICFFFVIANEGESIEIYS